MGGQTRSVPKGAGQVTKFPVAAPMRQSRADVFQPQDLAQLQSVADVIAKSNCIPQRYVGKPGDILVAAMMGREVGMGLMQSLQAVYVVHGTPGMFVEHMIGLVRASGKCAYLHTTVDRVAKIATCRTKRTDEEGEHVYTFSAADAAQAGYLKKGGAWAERDSWMMQVRATGLAMKHVYPDVTKGLQVAEMVQEYAATHPPAPSESDLMPREIGAPAVAAIPLVVPEERQEPPPAETFADPAAPSAEDTPDEPGSSEPQAPPAEPAKAVAAIPPTKAFDKPRPAPTGELRIPADWPEWKTKPISVPQAKRLYAISKKEGLEDDQLRAIVSEFGFTKSSEIMVGFYPAICNRVSPGSTEEK